MHISIVINGTKSISIYGACSITHLTNSKLITMFFKKVGDMNVTYFKLKDLGIEAHEYGQDSHDQTGVFKLILHYDESVQLSINE